eukprot:scaffold40718_cov63-Phaeocystis_antarctica.AAC.1
MAQSAFRSFACRHTSVSVRYPPIDASKSSLVFQSVPRLNAAPAAAYAGRGAVTASGDAPRDDHADGGWAGAAVRLGRIGCGGDLGRVEGGGSGGATLGGRAGCTEKVQCLTCGGASCGATTHGHGAGSTEGGARACLTNGGGHVESASHGRGEGGAEGGASADDPRGPAAYRRAPVRAEGGGSGEEHRGEDGAVAVVGKLPPEPAIEHERCRLKVRGAVTESGGEGAATGGEPADVAARRRAKGGAQQGQGRGRSDRQGHVRADGGGHRGAEQRRPGGGCAGVASEAERADVGRGGAGALEGGGGGGGN